MLDWLIGASRRTVLPTYSSLRKVSGADLPAALVREEAGDAFATRCKAIQEDLRHRSRDSQEDAPLFIELLATNGRGVLTIPMDDGAQCLPVFSSPIRAFEYAQTVLPGGPRVQCLSSTATQLLGMLRDVEKARIERIALDRCGRCSTFSMVASRSLRTAQDLLSLRTIHKASELARAEAYLAYARTSAHAGDLETSRDVTLQCVGHVTLEDPRAHLLLGELGVALRDTRLVREARNFLRFFKHDPWERRLAEVVQSGRASFD